MWTDESKTVTLIHETVDDVVVQRLLYQALMHIENFRHASRQLKDSFDTLLFHDFARTQSCHMVEDFFGADKHTAEMETAKVRVWGFLLNTATAGHKLLRCVVNARSKERLTDWASLRRDLRSMPDLYRRTRNFLEHLDEMTHREETPDIEDCKFSRHGVLFFQDKDGKVEFDFAEEGLKSVEIVWNKVIHMLEERRKASARRYPL